ncbi:transposase family Tnp2 protein [Gracilaria domingensis]|nr:transposase family Tnp2 protein [Gracilaria domingensis]
MSSNEWVCPPWFCCPCAPGDVVSKSTMLSHRRAANKERYNIGRGPFRQGFNAKALSAEEIRRRFTPFETLSDHGTDVERSTAWKFANSPEAHEAGNEGRNENNNIPKTLISREQHCADQMSAVFQTDANLDVQLMEYAEQNLLLQENDALEQMVSMNPLPHSLPDTAHLVPYPLSHGILNSGINQSESNLTFDWIKNNREVLRIFIDHGVSEAVMNDILQLPALKSPCRSWRTIVSTMDRHSTISEAVRKYYMCPGHSAYTSLRGERIPTCCAVCEKQLSAPNAEEGAPFYYLSLRHRIAIAVGQEATCNDFYEYRWNHSLNSEARTDFLDGSYFDSLRQKFGDDQLRYDLFFAVSTDGFDVYRSTSYSTWVVPALNLNLSPERRFFTQNIVPLMFTPGPGTPKDIVSFLRPLISEFQRSFDEEENKLILFDGVERSVRFHLVYFSGDQPAIAKDAGLQDHNGKSPCRNCHCQGTWVEESKHYYYPSKVRDQVARNNRGLHVVYNPRNPPKRTESDTNEVF